MFLGMGFVFLGRILSFELKSELERGEFIYFNLSIREQECHE